MKPNLQITANQTAFILAIAGSGSIPSGTAKPNRDEAIQAQTGALFGTENRGRTGGDSIGC